MYGMSELILLVTLSMTPEYLGYVSAHNEVKIADPDTEEGLGPNQEGEIMVRQPHFMVGYLNRPEENAKFFGKDGFAHTGDLGYYDENLTMYYGGRLKELIKFENRHIYPKEIEEEILKVKGVKDVGVFGTPDDLVQEKLTALVVKEDGSDLTEKDIEDHVAATLEDFKKLRGGAFFAPNLPRNPQGKLLRRQLLEISREIKTAK